MPDTDLSAISLLPAELQPETPIVTREELCIAAIRTNSPLHTALNAYSALRGDYVRLASAYVAITATPAPAPVDEDDVRLCKGFVIGYLINGPASATEIGVKLAGSGFNASDTLDALMGLERAGEIVYQDGRYVLGCDRDPSGDADLEVAAGNFRLAGSPFARPGCNIPARVPVPVAPLAVYSPDMTTGTLPDENRAAEALEELFRPTGDEVRAMLADDRDWDADDDDPSPAEQVVLDLPTRVARAMCGGEEPSPAEIVAIDLACMKYAMDAHREASNVLG